MAYYCYLLQCADGTYYCGWTKDVQRRLDTHNKGRGAKYTRIRRPVALVYYEELANQSEAMRREHKLKQKTREQKALLIQKFNEGSHERSI
jgi:Predicted endonuclease containing a URI domain